MKNKLHRGEFFRRAMSLAVALVMLLSFLPMTPHVHAAETETITVYFRNDWLWTDIRAHYWGSASGDSAWPGVEMVKVDTVEGQDIYSAEVPADITGLIFNGLKNDGSGSRDQTPDIKGIEFEDGMAFYIYWDNGNQYGTFDYTPKKATITVYFRNDWLWTDIRAHYWGSASGDSAWPGVEMVKVDTVEGQDIYSAEVPADITGLIFNGLKDDGSGNRDQTPDIKDITFEDGMAFYIYWDNGNRYGTFGYPPEENEPEVPEEPTVDYYLIGYINGADYGCNDDWQNLGEYKFVDGKLTATFTQDSYVFIKTGDNGNWYMTESYCSSTTGTFKNTSTGTSEKMFVPGNVELTFTLTVNDDDTLTLSYEVVQEEPEEPAAVDYYLIGYINGADYGCNDDWENLGEYKFVDGKLTATFTQDSYVFIKTGDNGNWYMTESYCSSTTGTFKNTSTGTSEKMFVPGNVELAFTLTVSDDDTLTLSYEKLGAEEPAEVAYYLYGYVNGADISENMDAYKFEDGELKATFNTADNYVFIKDSNGASYMAAAYCTDTTVTLKTGANEKMFVPGNKEVTFTLTVNADGTLTLSYAQVIETPEIPEGYNTVTIHFLKPATWGSAINAYLWNDDGAVSGYEHYNTWPGSPIPENADKDGWYDITVATENPQAFNFIFNDGSNQTADLTTGEVTGPTELWVVDGTVYTEAPRQWTHYTVIIHFQKPENWGGTVNAYAWDDNNQQLMGAWPGTVTSPSANTGWYNTTIYVEIGRTLNFIFNDGSNQTSDLSAGVLTGNTELWIGSDGNEVSKPNTWVDENRTIHLPGTLGGNNWNAAGNQMEYDVARGLYTITFENVTPGTYEYKIAVNGGWAENYGANGEANGGNMSVTVAEAQDITFWYNDSTHRVVCSVSYDIDAVVTLSGTGIADGTKLTDPDLKGLYTVTVELSAGTYSDLKITHGDYEVPFNEFELTSDRNVTFSYDPSTGMAYHNGSDKKVETGSIYYNSRDLDYKEPFGAVVAGEDVTFAISTGTDATAVVLAIRGIGSVKMTKDGEAVDGVQRWVCTTTFENIGEYQYYFAITNGSDMVFYCDDTWNSYYKTGDYGTGTVGNPDDIFAYDLVVYEAGYETPDWMKNAVIYQIFPDRFFDGDESNNFAQTWARGEVDYEFVSDWYLLPENPEMAGEPDYPTYAFKGDGNWSNEIYGGDLKGIVEKIDYLKALGVNVIYLNPVFWSISNHRYDAVSYAEIDPILGTLGDFEELVAVAEANDMHIILDGVFNHVSDDSIYFDRYYKFLPDAAEKYDGKIGAYPYWAYVYDYMNDNGADQATAEAAAKAYFGETYGITDYSYTEWFAVTNVKGSNGIYAYEGWWGYDSMPVIKSTNGSEYQTGNWAEEIIDGENSVNAYWISKGMDGWRLDVANEVSDETWQNFRDSVKALDSEAVIIGEIWADATHYLMGDMYDSVMNYVFRDAVAGFARGYLINRDNKAEKYDKDLTADEAMTILEILRERYPEEAFYAMMNLVASHDTSRILSYLDDLEDDRYQKDMEHAFPTYEKTSDRAKQLQYVVSFLQFTYAGAPTIYYGDEIGMVGGDDPDDRRAFTWGKGNQEIVEWYAELAAIRNAYPVLRTGSVEAFSTGDDDVMGFVRADDVNTVVVLANRANAEKTVAYEGTWVDLVSGKTFTDFITVPAYRGVILVAEEEVKTVTVNTAALAPAYDAAYTVAARADHAHKWNEGEQTVAPGCETDGEMTYTCTVDGCGETKTEAIAPTGHDHEATVTAPTCTEGGYTTYTCECGDSYISDEIPALGHNVVLKEEKAPGCETYGYEYYACERCGGAEYQLMIDPTGHNYEDGTCTGCGQADPDASKPGHGNLIGKWFDKWFGEKCDHEYESVVTAPTCTDRGYTTHTCIHCGDHYCDSYVAALGHDYEDGVCGSCGQAEPTKPSWGSIWDLIFWWR